MRVSHKNLFGKEKPRVCIGRVTTNAYFRLVCREFNCISGKADRI